MSHSESSLSFDYKTSRSRTSILVIDDDPAIVHMLREDLVEEGYKVTCGFDGQMAIRMARQLQPDLIIMDVCMPMTNGIKALEFLRSSPETAMIPIIFISGELSKDIFPKIENLPRVAHVKKPMDLESLNSLIRQFIQRYPGAE